MTKMMSISATTIALVLIIITIAHTFSSAQQTTRIETTLPFGTTTAAPTPPPPTTSTQPPLPPQFSVKCTIGNLGPVFNPNIPASLQWSLRTVGYAHKVFNRTTDVLLVVANKLPPGAPSSSSQQEQQQSQNGEIINTNVAAVNASNCNIIWTFQTRDPIVTQVEYDSSTCVFQTYNSGTKEASVFSLDINTGLPRNQLVKKNITYPGNILTAIHDGRIFVASTNGVDVKYPDQFGYEIEAFDAKTGRPDFGWNQCCINVPVDPSTGHANLDIFRHEIYLGFDVEASWGFLGYGNTIVGAEMVTGMREFEVSLEDVISPNQEKGNWQCNSASGRMGFIHGSEEEKKRNAHLASSRGPLKTLMKNKNIKFHKSEKEVDWSRYPLDAYFTCHNIYPTSSNNSRKSLILALHQQNGTLAYSTLETQSTFSTYQGPVVLNKFTSTACFLDNFAIVCFDSITGKFLFSTLDRYFKSTPVLSYTYQNYVLAASVDYGNYREILLTGFDQISGEVKFDYRFIPEGSEDEYFGVGYPKPFEDGYDVAIVGVGMKSSGFLTILKSTNN